MSRQLQLTIVLAATRARATTSQVEAALRTGDLRSLTPRDVDAWRRERIALRITPGSQS